MKKRVTVGTDPEFFLRRKVDGKLISAIPYIKGTKENPEPLENGGNVQFDNVAIEFATEPAKDGADLVKKVGNAFKDVLKRVPEGHELAIEPSGSFDADQLNTEEAQQFGCDPDYCAWELKVNDPPFCDDPALRTCGGHIHIGFNKGDGNDFLMDPYGKAYVVRVMDIFHGIISVVLDNSKLAVTRRKLYGKAGCHRPVAREAGGLYDGVEYRVLSNFWFKTPELVMLMDSLTQDVLKIMREDKHNELIETIGEKRIRNTIDSGDTKEAELIIEEFVRSLLSEDSVHYLTVSIEKLKANVCFVTEWQLESATVK